MRYDHAETSNSSSTSMGPSGAAALRNFSSPIPYLFGGLPLMLAVISIALLILACSYRSQYYSSSSSNSPCDDDEEKQRNVEVNSEPKIVVIMAGESIPTYLAKPAISSTTSHAALSGGAKNFVEPGQC